MTARFITFSLAFWLFFAGTAGVVSAAGPLDDLLNKNGSSGFLGNAAPNANRADEDPIVSTNLTAVSGTAADEVLLTIDITMPEGRHTYSMRTDYEKFTGATKVSITSVSGLSPLGTGFQADHEPEFVYRGEFGESLEEYEGRVKWTRGFRIEPGTAPGDVGLLFYLRFQSCDTNCILYTKYYKATLDGIEELDRKSFKAAALPNGRPFTEADAAEPPTPDLLSDLDDEESGVDDPFFSHLQYQDDEAGGDLAWFLLSAFIGGMILNVMPCVLPVLAIKILSFVQQAGESRLRIFLLNLSYTGGVLIVFLFLATLAVFLDIGWGGLFQKPEFNLVMACLVFAMGLSLLGVFEIPVPGFVGSAAGNAQQQEGLSGAFLTGIFATLLATPCSGPFLGATLGWSVGQPTHITYLVWGTMGLGMAFPYLLFGMFPFAIKWLPKPGMWMVRFKEFSGFVLMGTVIFLMNTLKEELTMPLLVMLLGISLGLWMVGNLYDVSTKIRHKWTVRGSALVLTALICGYGYSMTKAPGVQLPWKKFTYTRLKQELDAGRTVLIDFTADWCLTCKVVERYALNTSATIEFVNEHNVVTLKADYTHGSPAIKDWLDKFDSEGVPLTVVFPGGDHKRPIVIRDVYTKSKLLSKLDQAVNRSQAVEASSTPVAEPTAARM